MKVLVGVGLCFLCFGAGLMIGEIRFSDALDGWAKCRTSKVDICKAKESDAIAGWEQCKTVMKILASEKKARMEAENRVKEDS